VVGTYDHKESGEEGRLVRFGTISKKQRKEDCIWKDYERRKRRRRKEG
jgi:hypothetical protein